MSKQPSLPAFTFIEILIVITISMLLLGSGIVAYIRFNETQVIRSHAKEVQTFFRLAQKKARAGDRPEGCGRLDAYRLETVANQPQLIISAVCRGQEYETDSFYMIDNVVFSETLQIDFASIQGGVTNSGTVTLERDGRMYSFEVGAGGDITQGEFVEEQ